MRKPILAAFVLACSAAHAAGTAGPLYELEANSFKSPPPVSNDPTAMWEDMAARPYVIAEISPDSSHYVIAAYRALQPIATVEMHCNEPPEVSISKANVATVTCKGAAK